MAMRSLLLCVMENDANRIPVSPTDATDAVPEIDPIRPARTPHRSMVNRENDAVTVLKRYHHRPRLHARPLLRHHEFAAHEVLARLGQQDGELKRENMLTVEVLMQAVVIIGAVLEQKRCRPRLSFLLAAL